MASSLSHPKPTSTATDITVQLHYTIYTCPYLFYPRRIHSYLLAKPLPANVKLTLVRTEFDANGQMTMPAGKIEGSIPMLRMDSSDGAGEVWIRQSLAILEYLEEVHPRRGKGGVEVDMRGATALERARVTEIISLVEEASQAFGFMVMHSAALYTPLVAGGQSHSAFQAARARLHKTLETLESYARQGLEEGKWAAGTRGLTIADLCLGSLVEYARDMYGWDLTNDHDVVAKWLEKWEKTEAGQAGGEKIPPQWMTELAMKRVWEE